MNGGQRERESVRVRARAKRDGHRLWDRNRKVGESYKQREAEGDRYKEGPEYTPPVTSGIGSPDSTMEFRV